jgi:hypothetical protein
VFPIVGCSFYFLCSSRQSGGPGGRGGSSRPPDQQKVKPAATNKRTTTTSCSVDDQVRFQVIIISAPLRANQLRPRWIKVQAMHRIVARRRLSFSCSSSRGTIGSTIFENDVDAGDASDDGGEDFVRDGGREGAIFLVGNHLGDRGVARVVHGLQDPCREYYKLYLCDNRIGRLGAALISCALEHNSKLIELSLGSNHIGDEGAGHLARSLMHNGTLRMLNLEKNNIGPRGISELSRCLEQNNTVLRWLVLSENPIGNEGARALLRCVGNTVSFDTLLKCNHSLTSIITKKVSQVTGNTTLRKIQCHLKINRRSAPSSTLAAQRKVLWFANENHSSLLEYIRSIQSDDAMNDMDCITRILALLACQRDVSTLLAVLINTPSLFLKCPDIKYIRGTRDPGMN